MRRSEAIQITEAAECCRIRSSISVKCVSLCLLESRYSGKLGRTVRGGVVAKVPPHRSIDGEEWQLGGYLPYSGTRGNLSLVLPVTSCGGVGVVARCQGRPRRS